MPYFNMFIFFACTKKTNQQRSGERKCSRSLAAALLAFGFPALLVKSGRFGKSRSLYPLAGCSAESFNRTLLCCSAA